MNKLAKHYYTLGAQTALRNMGMEKPAYYDLVSRLAPMGTRNITAGAGHVGAGSILGFLLGAAVSPELTKSMVPTLLGAGAGKLLKDRNTLNIAKSLNPLEKAVVSHELGKGVSGRVGGAALSLLGSGGNPLVAIPEVITNQLVRKRLGM